MPPREKVERRVSSLTIVIALTIVSGLAALVWFLEVSTHRLLVADFVPVSPYWQGPALSFDPELLLVYTPHARCSFTSRGDLALMRCRPGPQYSHDVRYNGNGFRNDEDLTAADVQSSATPSSKESTFAVTS